MRKVLLAVVLLIAVATVACPDTLRTLTLTGSTPDGIAWKFFNKNCDPGVVENEFQVGGKSIGANVKLFAAFTENSSGAKYAGVAFAIATKSQDGWAMGLSLNHYEGLGRTKDKEKYVFSLMHPVAPNVKAGLYSLGTKVSGVRNRYAEYGLGTDWKIGKSDSVQVQYVIMDGGGGGKWNTGLSHAF